MIETILIFVVFAVIHSLTASQRFKRFGVKAAGKTFMRVWYRFLYTGLSAVTGVVAVYLLRQVPDRILWSAPLWLRFIMHGVQLAGLFFGLRAFEHLDLGEFLGFRQVRRYLARGETAGTLEGLTEKELVTTGVYGLVRHPLYLSGILMATFFPVITVKGLTLTALADLYFFFGMLIEERRFVKIFGDQYREYMKRVPRLCPNPFRRG
jgi:methanethiol S-methyltransferase